MHSLTVVILVIFMVCVNSAKYWGGDTLGTNTKQWYRPRDYRRVCYYTNWSQYRHGAGKFVPENIDPNLCTHVIYAFAGLEGNRIKPGGSGEESTSAKKGLFERFTDLKKRNPALKTMISLGGYTVGSEMFSQMAATDASRQEFASTSIKFLRDHNFDGIDMDWEFPANRGSPPEDKQRFGELLKVIKNAFDAESRASGKPRLILAAATSTKQSTVDSAYDLPTLAKYLDMINLMTYDMHGHWENTTGHNSPLYMHDGEAQNVSLHTIATYYTQHGVPEAMINIGLGLYGRSFTLSDPSKHDIGAPVTGPGDAGRFTSEKGFVAYFEICEMFKTGGTKYYLADQMVPYLVKGSQWVGYDDVESLKPKVKYVKQHHYGGIMAWAVDLDDYNGVCGQGKYPLLNAIKNELANSTAIVGTDDKFCQQKNDGHYIDPNDCSKFYICSNGMGLHEECQDGTVFNKKIHECDLPARVPSCHKSVSGSGFGRR